MSLAGNLTPPAPLSVPEGGEFGGDVNSFAGGEGGGGGEVPFTKMQAVGNDFVVIEESVWGEDTDWAQEAIRLCDQHKGIGGDGLLIVCQSAVADVRMRMFNPDGTEDMCGNGLRCVIAYAVERNAIPKSGNVETLSGSIPFTYEAGRGESPNRIDTTLPPPRFDPADIPAISTDGGRTAAFPLRLADGETVTISSVNTGSTHTVVWVAELPDDDTFLRISPQIEHHALFPERTSVLWAKTDEWNRYHLRIWERGVGETLGCGTGAAAVYAIANAEHKNPLGQIYSKGGALSVHLLEDFDEETDESEIKGIVLRGAAYTVYSGFMGR